MFWENFVVKINVKSTNVNFNKPLDISDINNSSGTGFFITNHLILTCYHVVKYAVNIEIIYDQINTINGELAYIFPDDDLAIIKINEKIDSIQILPFKEIKSKERLVVYSIGFPSGNENIIETKGIISGYRKSLIQTDATLNPGNSGGPLVMHNKESNQWMVIGINVSKFIGVENTGFVVPCYRFNILRNYLCNNLKNPIVIHKPQWDFDYQLIKQDSLREHLFKNIKDKDLYIKKKLGARITLINKKNYLYKYIQENDIIISINGNYVDLNGYIKFDFFPEKISLSDLNVWFTPNDIITVKILDSKLDILKDIPIKLEYNYTNLLNYYAIDGYPNYYIENNNIILSIFTKQHFEKSGDLDITMVQLIKLLNRRLYKQDLFTVYLVGLNPKIYKQNLFNKYPIGDIITEINNKTFDDYESFINIVQKESIISIKTIENKIFFIKN
jgi:hypothetical protein